MVVVLCYGKPVQKLQKNDACIRRSRRGDYRGIYFLTLDADENQNVLKTYKVLIEGILKENIKNDYDFD